MNESEEEKYGLLIDELNKDAGQAAWFHGFLESVVNNREFLEKLESSISGRIAVVARAGVKTSLILYVARAWDRRNDAISLCRAFDQLPSLIELEERRNQRLRSLNIEPDEGGVLEADYEAFKQAYSDAEKNPIYPKLRLLRTERFAHRVLESDSRDRLNYSKNSIPVEDANYNDLLGLSRDTLNLVGQVRFLWSQDVNPYPDMINHSAVLGKEFWRVMPVIRDVESI